MNIDAHNTDTEGQIFAELATETALINRFPHIANITDNIISHDRAVKLAKIVSDYRMTVNKVHEHTVGNNQTI